VSDDAKRSLEKQKTKVPKTCCNEAYNLSEAVSTRKYKIKKASKPERQNNTIQEG
jgi:hypothetical protein